MVWQGMQCSDWELSASFLEYPTLYLVKDKHTTLPYVSVWQWLGTDQLPTYWGGVLRLQPHFPYGYLVEPDRI